MGLPDRLNFTILRESMPSLGSTLFGCLRHVAKRHPSLGSESTLTVKCQFQSLGAGG